MHELRAVIRREFEAKAHLNDQCGQGLLELAIIIPVLAVIIAGALDLGRIFFSIITVTNVAREGARYLTLHPEDEQNVDHPCNDLVNPPALSNQPFYCTLAAARQEARTTLWVAIVNPANITITATCPDIEADAGCDKGSTAVVSATYTDSTFLSRFFVPSITINRVVRMLVP
jgi:Flp pilus assembly protein TadG